MGMRFQVVRVAFDGIHRDPRARDVFGTLDARPHSHRFSVTAEQFLGDSAFTPRRLARELLAFCESHFGPGPNLDHCANLTEADMAEHIAREFDIDQVQVVNESGMGGGYRYVKGKANDSDSE